MSGFFNHIVAEPPNSILGVALECKNDSNPNKINLTIGAYRDEQGNPEVLDCVREAEQIIFDKKYDHEYLNQDGLPEFCLLTQKLMFGEESEIVRSKRAYTIQTVAGTGSVRLAIDFLHAAFPYAKCYLPSTTWPNHNAVLDASGMSYETYRYLDNSGCALDFSGLITDINSAPTGSVILFHSCAHNPSGVDPTDEQWKEILAIVQQRKLFPLFDNAYQGFVSGDPEKDAYSVRLFAAAGLNMIVCASFSKNFGLYGERTGALHIVTDSPEEAERCATVLRAMSRVLYSTCPTYGARIVGTILGDPRLKQDWLQQCKAMADRLNEIRALLHQLFLKHNVKGTWNHIIEQRGMFSYSGISAATVKELKEKHSIYMLSNGRISLAGLNKSNVERFVAAVASIIGTN